MGDNGKIKKGRKQEISSEQEVFIMQQLAQLKPALEVTKLCNANFPQGKQVSVPTVYYYKRTRAPTIDELRDKFLSKAMEVPIADEKTRLSRTEYLYQAAAQVVTKADKRVLSAVETSLKCLKEAREEIKGEGGSTQNYLQLNQYNQLTDEQLLEKEKELELKFIELSKKGANSYEVACS